MKFLQLKSALESAMNISGKKSSKPSSESQNQTRPCPENNSSNTRRELWSGSRFVPDSTKARILTDKIHREPIDRTARLVTQKCPWWAKLIYEPTNINIGNRKIEGVRVAVLEKPDPVAIRRFWFSRKKVKNGPHAKNAVSKKTRPVATERNHRQAIHEIKPPTAKAKGELSLREAAERLGL